MTMKELLKACGSGEMPRVLLTDDLCYRTGTICTIKNGSTKGCAVIFDTSRYEQWFHDSQETDRRRRYMRDLMLIETEIKK